MLLFVHRVSFLGLLDGVVDDQLIWNIFTKHKDSVFLSHYQFGFPILRGVRVNIRVRVVNSTGHPVKAECDKPLLKQKFEELLKRLIYLLFRDIDLPEVGGVHEVSKLVDYLILEIPGLSLRPSNKDLLQNSDNVGIVKSLSRQSINYRRNINFPSCEKGRVVELSNRLIFVLLQEIDVRRVSHLRHNLEVRFALLDSFVDENSLSIKHLIFKLRRSIRRRVMAPDNSLISFMNLGFPQHLHKQREPVDDKDSGEPGDRVPDITWDSLSRDNDHDILLLALQVFSS